ARRIGDDILGPGLAELAARHPIVGEVRGRGVFWAVELVADQDSREPVAPTGGSSPVMAQAVRLCKERGLLPFTNSHRIHLVPPCTVSADEAREGLRIVDEVLGHLDDLPATSTGA
ncbi:aminotransferase class III-fold pyridoxal phosphate-dependent enzyme, partial [Streptomyces sp. CO7]